MAASPTRSRSTCSGSTREIFERDDPAPYLEHVHGILVPGGFGERGSDGKIEAATLRPRQGRALFRHLLWHADGLHRSGP